ncbi:MAG: 4-hydroxy-tetrahydrodipicolinate reductase [Lachnospiraceae bacterium]|jgi:4-hydroxy-tetrahydrodipicolinate reductase|nr:4-hydroxy-tetrahydrodipicolinate reductase [Lachnospiraceae bacterium]
MTRLILHGCNGAMGQVIVQIAGQDPEIKIAAGVDLNARQKQDFPVYASLMEVKEEADVIIDFASASAADGLLDFCREKKIPLVLCTTGLSEEQLKKAEETAQSAALLRSANMSLGVNTLLKLVAEAAKTLAAAGFDVEIVEKHHNQKMDSPSGTALALADSVNHALEGSCHYVYDRTTKREKRDSKEIGISAVRGGSIVGEHDVIFAGKDEVVTFSHTAYSKAIFAKGAVEAAKFLAGKAPGLYTMADVINS